jgi:hypothetical protein
MTGSFVENVMMAVTISVALTTGLILALGVLLLWGEWRARRWRANAGPGRPSRRRVRREAGHARDHAA